ncbi:hypothetical protein GCM10011506_06140 [Marivirga lumbricoides]|uniref:Nucleotide exchange factor GrpE n=1 Tax=Marivirga lumbricoides TaxID=1046115 RepID=A0ABQ1LEP8_9BACT|nr:hypothetical protein GCM10011506_06140 [Marivirga lumbricoides]
MEKHEITKKQSKQKIDEVLSEYEILKAEARNAQAERKKEIEDNIKELDEREKELRAKYDEMEHFGDTTLEELSKAFFTSANAFSDHVNKVKKKI